MQRVCWLWSIWLAFAQLHGITINEVTKVVHKQGAMSVVPPYPCLFSLVHVPEYPLPILAAADTYHGKRRERKLMMH